jgi:hydrogenase maturation protease
MSAIPRATSCATIVGLGSPNGDDRLGWIVVDRLAAQLSTATIAVKAGGGSDLLNVMAGQTELVVVDAAAPAGTPGKFRALEWPCDDLLECTSSNTHGIGVAEVLRLAEAIGVLPLRVCLWTIEAEQTAAGEPNVSPSVVRGIDEVVSQLLRRFTREMDLGRDEVTRPHAELSRHPRINCL